VLTTAKPFLLEHWALHSDLRHLYGLVYADPNGVPRWEVLRLYATQVPHMDLLIHVGATGLKRRRTSLAATGSESGTGPDTLADTLHTLPKDYWLVRAPEGQQQWTFLYGTQYKNTKDWPGLRLYRIDTLTGRATLRRLSLTEKEQQHAQQGCLFTP
jgi:hypothetical protein